jgi:hypothetical protein
MGVTESRCVAPQPGAVQSVTVDAGNAVHESDEGNNGREQLSVGPIRAE